MNPPETDINTDTDTDTDTDTKDLPQDVAQLLGQAGMRLTLAESCTGGLIAATLTALPGSSAWFDGGAVVYSNRLKASLLGVDAHILNTHGAVSAECAAAMVTGCLARLGGDVALAVTGIAGPTGGSPEKPVGTVFIGLAAKGQAAPRIARLALHGDRHEIQQQTMQKALAMLRRLLLSP